MEKIAASLLATAGIACAQTYNYDSSSETLVITGKGNTVADRITLEGPITPGSTVPGTSEIFGDTKEIILKDVWTSPDSIRIKYVEPTSEGNNTTLKLENSRLGASGDFVRQQRAPDEREPQTVYVARAAKGSQKGRTPK